MLFFFPWPGDEECAEVYNPARFFWGARACGVAAELRALRRERAPRLGGRRVRRDLEGSKARGSPAVLWCYYYYF